MKHTHTHTVFNFGFFNAIEKHSSMKSCMPVKTLGTESAIRITFIIILQEYTSILGIQR